MSWGHKLAGRTPSAKAAAAAERRTPATGRSAGRKASKGVSTATATLMKGGRGTSPRPPTTTSRKGRNIKAGAPTSR